MALSGSLTQHYGFRSPLSTSQAPYVTSSDDKKVFSLTATWEVVEQDVVYGRSTVNWKLYASAIDFSKIEYSSIESPTKLVFGTDAIDSGTGSQYNDMVLQTRYYDAEGYLDNSSLTTQFTTKTLNVTLGSTEKNKLIQEGSFVMSHRSDGQCPAYITFNIRVKNFYDDKGNAAYLHNWSSGTSSNYTQDDFGMYGEAICTITPVFDPISKHAILKSVPAHFTDEDSPVIEYAVPSGMTGYIYLSLDGKPETESTTPKAVTGAGTYNYSFSEADQAKLWGIRAEGLTDKSVKFYIRSVRSGTTYRETPKNQTTTLELINWDPTWDDGPEIWDINQDVIDRLTGNQYKLVRYVSNAKFVTNGIARKGATIDTETTINDGKPLDGPTGVFEKVGSDTFIFNIMDNYGTQRSATTVLTSPTHWVNYVPLTCSIEASPMTADGEVLVTLRGKFFNGDFGKKINRLRMNYDLYQNNEDFDHKDWGYIDRDNGTNASTGSYAVFTYDSTTSDYTYEFLISGLEYLSVYEMDLRVSDEVDPNVPLARQTVLASVPIFDWSRTDFAFNVPVTIEGNNVPCIVEQQLTDSGWSYRKWSDGTAECWRTLSVTAAVSTSTNASWYSSGELLSTNLSFPFTFAARPSVTVQTMPTGQSWCIVFPSNTTGSNTKTGSYQLNSMSSTSSRTHLLSYDVKGRWK